MYKILTKNNRRYITIPILNKLGLKNCFTTKDSNMRIGGVSNNGTIKDYEYAFNFLNINPITTYISEQKHTNNITIIDSNKQGRKFDVGRIINNNDGFVTNKKNIVLTSLTADCTPIILFDPIKKVHANIHSGWRGTLQKIVQNGINKMITYYDSNPSDIIAILGPSISKDDFEVEYDVKSKFSQAFTDFEDIIFKKDKTKYLIDLDKINNLVLLNNGIKKENIININLSTFSNSLFHSYRRDKSEYQLMACITCL